MTIFQSQAWQSAWWATWGGHSGFTLVKPWSVDNSGLYTDAYTLRELLPLTCLQFVGTNYRRLSTPRSEYNCLKKGDDPSESVTQLNELESINWDEAVFRDVRASSADTQAIHAWASRHRWNVRQLHQDRAYSVKATPSFSDYLARLGSATRLRLFNRRKVLAQIGLVSLENYWPSRPADFFELLNGFHEKRWGVPCFNADSLSFHKAFLHAVVHEGGEPELSVLTLNGDPISVVYNVVYRGCIYNLQSGYVENFHKKVALGMLHLGYCLERAFADEAIERFDLLAGHGKNTDYKRHIATDEEELVSLMVVRSRVHRAIYRSKDTLGRFKSLLQGRSGRLKSEEPAV